MCSNYLPVTRSDRMLKFFGIARDRDELPADMWPLGLAPFIRIAEDGSGHPVCDDGVFGLLPHFAVEMAQGRKTYNARTETVARLPSFRDAWRLGQRCIVPAEAIYEPNWESGASERWMISRPGEVAMGIAGIYTRWHDKQHGRELFSFAMLTVNADGHPVMQRFHRPGDEKRMVVILPEADYGAWLSCRVDEAVGFFRPYMGPLETQSAALPKRALKAPQTVTGKVVMPPSPVEAQVKPKAKLPPKPASSADDDQAQLF
jgi:putative SOS response-associated peptidase YedK